MARAASPYDSTVPNRRIALLLAATTVAGLAVTGCGSPATLVDEQAAAVRVNDATVSRGEFQDQLDEFYENDGLRSFLFEASKEQLRPEGGAPGSYTQEYVGFMARVQVQFLVVAEVLDQEGIEITADDRAAVTDELAERVEGGVDELPDDIADTVVEWFAGYDKLRSELGEEEFNAAVNEAVDGATIEVNSRYGTWDRDRFQVTPPEGPAPAPGEGSDAAGALPR